MIGSKLEKYTFDVLLEEALAKVPDSIDKREGSIIYDALAPACYILAEYYMNLRYFYLDVYALTATEKYLDYKVAEAGISRYQAIPAIKRGIFKGANGTPLDIEIGSRFTTITDNPNRALIYQAIARESEGVYLLRCETPGVIGNGYIGNLLAVTHINGLATAYLDTLLQPGTDIESDDALRARYLDSVNTTSFGGNIAQYREFTKSINGVGEVQIYPTWKGGGTVLLSIVDSEYRACSDEFISYVQNEIDPEHGQQQGLGMAPIGHQVTVTTPQEVPIQISAKLTLHEMYSVGRVREHVELEIETYISTLRSSWANANDNNHYYSMLYINQINARILAVEGIVNVSDTKINGSSNDLILLQSAQLQELPILKEVEIYD